MKFPGRPCAGKVEVVAGTVVSVVDVLVAVIVGVNETVSTYLIVY